MSILSGILAMAAALWLAEGAGAQERRVPERVLLFTDAPPVVREGRTLAPVRAVSEAVGAQVRWLPASREAVINRAGMQVRLAAGSRRAVVDGRSVALDVAAAVEEGRMLVPVRFLAEEMGVPVRYEAATHSVLLDTRPTGGPLRVLPLFTVRGGIHVLAPEPDAALASPVWVHGQANTFEGGVVIEVQAPDGQVLGSGIATGAMGTFHPFTAEVAFTVPAGVESGRLFLYSPGGRDGEILHPTTVAVRFRP